MSLNNSGQSYRSPFTSLQLLLSKGIMVILSIVLFTSVAYSQTSDEYSIVTVGFYNVENLFDTINSPGVYDEGFLPESKREWNTEKYNEKLDRLAEVISKMGVGKDKDGLDILGLAEVENLSVMLDLVNQERIKDRRYQVIHADSPDKRGIDVGLIFNPKVFVPSGFDAIEVLIYGENGKRIYTRDILHVWGRLHKEEFHFFVNHWPSRVGGEAASAPNRNKAAQICRDRIDEIKEKNPDAKIVIMGDMNDDPSSASIKKYLNVQGKEKNCEESGLFNTMESYYNRGIGTLAYRDSWNLFDQIIISCPILNDKKGYHYHSGHIFKEPYMVQKFGTFKGYPYRTYVGDNYQGGYSDHFPVYIHLVKEHTR